MRRMGQALLSLVVAGALVASCEQQIVVVDRDGGGGNGGGAGDEGSAEYVASSSVGTTTGEFGVGGACANAPDPPEPITQCESATSATVATGGGSVCQVCAVDAAGREYVTQCTDSNCSCYIDSELCFTCVDEQPIACGVSCCGYPWSSFDTG